MRNSVKKVLILLAVVTSLFAVQAAWAKCPSTCDITVTGTVSAVNYDENSITVGDTTVYGIPFSNLAKWLGLELSVDSSVSITAKRCPLQADLWLVHFRLMEAIRLLCGRAASRNRAEQEHGQGRQVHYPSPVQIARAIATVTASTKLIATASATALTVPRIKISTKKVDNKIQKYSTRPTLVFFEKKHFQLRV